VTGTDIPGALGTAVPGFELGELIGRGGCASVYRARQTSVGRDVALKIDNRHVTSERDRRRFKREVTSVGRLSGHPHVVEVYDAGVLPDDRPWIAMQLCPRGSLHEHVREHGPLGLAELQRVGVQLADALATAHDVGIVHRDVKPGNVLVNNYGVVMLSDFGLASVVDADSRHTATRGVYTPAYAAPEALGLDEPRPAMDLWSFACTIFELATGRLPQFRGRGEPIGPDDVVGAALAPPSGASPSTPPTAGCQRHRCATTSGRST
jgi:serine/threonine protein kinase